MLTNYSKIPIKLGILLVGFGLLVAGCDSAGPSANDNEEETPEAVSYEITNDVGERLSTVDGSSSSSSMKAQAKNTISFERTQQLNPPSITGVTGATVRASHMVLSSPPANGGTTPKLYIGYKVFGSPIGGGIDILEAPSSGPLNAPSGVDVNALQTDDADIQELALRENSNDDPVGLLAATDTDLNFQLRPQLHGIEVASGNGIPKPTGNGDVNYEWDALEHPSLAPTEANSASLPKIAKSVVDDPSTNTTFAVSDEGTLHAYDTGSNARDIDGQQVASVARSSAEFRSVALGASGNVYVLTQDGRVFDYSFSGSSFSEVRSTTLDPVGVHPDGGDSANAIARLTTYVPSSHPGEYIIAALGTNGFRVLRTDQNSLGTVFNSVTDVDTEISTPSVTGAGDYLYAANGDGFAIFDVTGGFTAEYLGRERVDPSGHTPSDPGPQVNHIIADHNASGKVVLYVAKSTDGVYRFEETSSSAY